MKIAGRHQTKTFSSVFSEYDNILIHRIILDLRRYVDKNKGQSVSAHLGRF